MRTKKHKNGTVYGLTEVIRNTGMKLPICFEFEYDTENEMWVGAVVLRKKNNEYDMEQIMALYKPVADKLFNRIGKTTPKRRTEGRSSHWLFVRRRGNIQRRAEILKLI